MKLFFVAEEIDHYHSGGESEWMISQIPTNERNVAELASIYPELVYFQAKVTT